MPPAAVDQEYWIMYFNGSLMKKGAGAGLVFVSPLGVHMRYMVQLHFPSSNNTTEYEVLINGLRIAVELGIRRLDVRGDNQLVVNQVMKESSCHDAKMEAYYQEVRWLEDRFDGLELNHIPRRLNKAADMLAKAAYDWRTLYLDYLLHNILPADKTKAQRLARHAKSFVLVEGELYK